MRRWPAVNARRGGYLRACATTVAAGLVLVCAAPAAAGGRLTSASELSAFHRWISSRYPGAHGYSACPQAQIFRNQGICLAEVKAGRTWHMLHAAPTLKHGRIVLLYQYDTAWTRRWSRFSRSVIAGFHTPGTASVNSPAYDWAFLAQAAHFDWRHHRTSFSIIDYDGPSSGFEHLFTFDCHVRGRTIACRNALGDAIHYRPQG
jgi:hypothetical protein